METSLGFIEEKYKSRSDLVSASINLRITGSPGMLKSVKSFSSSGSDFDAYARMERRKSALTFSSNDEYKRVIRINHHRSNRNFIAKNIRQAGKTAFCGETSPSTAKNMTEPDMTL